MLCYSAAILRIKSDWAFKGYSRCDLVAIGEVKRIFVLRGAKNGVREKLMVKDPSSSADGKSPSGVVFVLGAGVDRVFGLPLLNDLFRDLAEFARGTSSFSITGECPFEGARLSLSGIPSRRPIPQMKGPAASNSRPLALLEREAA